MPTVHVTPRAVLDLPTIDPGATAGRLAAALAADHRVRGDAFTLKADGVVLAPGDRVPSGAAVLEVIEHTAADTPAPPTATAPASDGPTSDD